jgi:hypothetical protein
VKEKSITVRIGKPTIEYRLSKEAQRYAERISNPQDLWDGLLAVEHDRLEPIIIARLKRDMEFNILSVILAPPTP